MSAYATIGQLIKASYANLGVADIENDLTPAQYKQGLDSLNSMIGGWSRKRQTLQGQFDETYTLVNGTATYAVGTGLAFNTTKPIEVGNAFVRDTNGTDFEVYPIPPGQYDQIPVKTIISRPEVVLYDPRTGAATFYPVPDANWEFHWSVQKLITSFATIEDTISLPEEYEEAMEYNLSLRLAPKVNVPVTKEVAMIASTSLANLTMAIEPAKFDGAFCRSGRYNIFSDSY